tara:strand:- start:447 stop:698 length:252 start_codon:yes stop_codon:yes gene_type:complete
MDIDIIYAAGFVGKDGGKIELFTDDMDEAFLWTRDNQSPEKLAVFRGYTQQHIDWGTKYMESILVRDVLAYDGYWHEVRRVAS